MSADEAATKLKELLACQQGPIIHYCYDRHDTIDYAIELGEHIEAVLLELERLRHLVNSLYADLRLSTGPRPW